MKAWQQMEEAGSPAAVRLLSVLSSHLPHPILVLVAIPVSFFYYIIYSKPRRAIRLYAAHLKKARGKRVCAWKCFLSFAITLIEKCESWAGKISANSLDLEGDVEKMNGILKEGRGVFLIVSHIGNTEELRALSDELSDMGVKREIPILSVMDVDLTKRFNETIKGINKSSASNIIDARKITMESVEEIESALGAGGIVVIAGDRAADKNIMQPFLGEEAPFPFGAFYLPALLSAPSFFAVCARKKDISLRKKYVVHVKENRASWEGMTRKEKRAQVERSCAEYARLLERVLEDHPCQWFNFYDFWRA